MAAYGWRHSVDQSRIPDREVEFHPHSFADPGGRLFRWRGGLYRALSRQQSSFISRLFQSGTIERLIRRGLLIESEITDYALEGYDLVIRHRAIPFPSYPNEWCAAMLKDAALAIIELARELAGDGLTLKDAHPWNLVFDDCRPVYVDLNSIAPAEQGQGWQAGEEFRRFCLNPLILMSRGQERLARLMMPEDEGVTDSFLAMFERGGVRSALVNARAEFASRARRMLKPETLEKQQARAGLADLLRRIEREVEGVVIAPPESSALCRDQGRGREAVSQLLGRLRPDTLLDVGGNFIGNAEAARESSNRAVVFSDDPGLVARLYLDCRARRLPILPLIVDFTKPTPARGLCDHWSIAASDRFKCDLVLALDGAIDDLTRRRQLNFEQVAEGLSLFSDRWVVAEIGAGAPDNFVGALRARFKTVSVLPSGEPDRALVLGEQ